MPSDAAVFEVVRGILGEARAFRVRTGVPAEVAVPIDVNVSNVSAEAVDIARRMAPGLAAMCGASVLRINPGDSTGRTTLTHEARARASSGTTVAVIDRRLEALAAGARETMPNEAAWLRARRAEMAGVP